MKETAYIIVYGDWSFYYKPLRPTGRWKLVNNEYGANHLYIEHRGLLFKSWVHEHNIEFHPERSEQVFNCTT